MKNLKKILAVGALLAMGTMAMGATDADGRGANENFDITLNVVTPLTITNDGDVEFGDLTVNQIETGGESERGQFAVAGESNKDVKFTVPLSGTLSNGTSSIGYTSGLFRRGTDTPLENATNYQLDGTGNLLGDLEITLDPATTPANGLYSGIINVEVSYD